MMFVYSWICFIFFLTISLKIYLCKKYKDVMDIFPHKNNWFVPLDLISLKPLRESNDERVKKVRNIILAYKILYFSGIATFIILVATGIL